MEKSNNLLVTLADANFIDQAKQLFSSVYWNAGWRGDYMLLAHEIPEDKIKWFVDKGILVKRCNPIYNDCLGDGNYSTAVLNKFYLFTEEFKKWEHIVFLDADIIVRNSLELFANAKSINSTRTTRRGFRGYFSFNNSAEIQALKKEYNLNRSSFNSGAIAFNTDLIKTDTFGDLLALFYKYACISNGDDSILNLYFYKYWKKVPFVYNVRVNKIPPLKIKAVILHFERPFRFCSNEEKPWQKDSSYYSEWKTNLEKAEKIDINQIQKVRIWSSYEAILYSFVLRVKVVILRILNSLKRFFIYIYFILDRSIGIIGLIIKKIWPNLYQKLTKIKDGK